MFDRIEHSLQRADAGCQLWPLEVANISALILNTLYFLDLDFFQRAAAERAREAIVAYANSRCIAELHALRHRDEALRENAYLGLDDLRAVVKVVGLNNRATSLGLKCA